MKEFKRLFDAFPYQLKYYAQEDALCCKLEDGTWKKYSTQECLDIINKVSIGLLKMGIKKGDKVALIANNRPEWNFIDAGLLQIGAVNVPIYPTITEKDYIFIFNDAEVKMAFVSDADLYGKVSNIKSKVESLNGVYTFDEVPNAPNWKEVIKDSDISDLSELKAIGEGISELELATIIYTSGTTGNPKGVMLSHQNICSNIASVHALLPITEDQRTLSFLPLCHIFERTVSYTYIVKGCSIYYAESIETVGDNLKEVKPHYFTTVPRLLEKVYEKIIAKGEALEGIKKKLFFWAVDLGLEYDTRGKSAWYKFKLGIARKLIFSKWKEALGNEIIGIITGAAALQLRLERLFNGAGILVRQGYGMTESSPVITVNRLNDDEAMIGTVGKPVPGVEVKLDPATGEILARGKNVMMGYYNRPDATAETIDADGWLHTGDKGEWVDGTYLKITDRIKELFKTSGGKYVAPQPIENKFKEAKLIEQIMVVGNNMKFVSALIVPNFPALEGFCKSNGLSCASVDEMINHPKVLEEYNRIRDEFNTNFGKVEQVKVIRLMNKEWDIDTGELTPTMKVKRKVILEKYSNIVNEIYNM